MPEFGELKSLPIRNLWPHEARDFTRWLADNVTKLGEAVGIDLEITQIEADVGDFSLDVLAKDLGTGRKVVIENQFGPTNHDHLGKLLTYAAGLDAGAVIWLAETIREEHRQALQWLNEHSDDETHFFAVTVEVFQIDNSRPAFEFRPVVYPNEWQRSARASADRGRSPRAESYRVFFQKLIDELREKHHFTGARAAQPQSWYSFSSGISGVRYAASFAQGGRVRAEVYLELGDADRNKALFDRLRHQKDEIENDFGETLQWERLDDRIASRIATYRPGSIEMSGQELQDVHTWLVDRLLRMKRVFGSRLGREVTASPQTRSASP